MTPHGETTEVLLDGAETRDLQGRREERRRLQRRRRRRIGVGVGAGALVLTVAGLLGSTGSDIPPKVSVGGVDVGGLSVEKARNRLSRHATTVRDGEVRLTGTAARPLELTVPADALTSGPRLDEALAAARSSRSRVGSALARIGMARSRELPLRYILRNGAVTRILRDARTRIGHEPVPATIAVRGRDVVTTPAAAGTAVDRDLLVARLETLPASVELPLRAARPVIDDDDAAAAKALAQRVSARGREVTLGERSTRLEPATLRKALRFPRRQSTLAVELDPDVLRSAVLRPLRVAERPPTDARLEIRGERVAVVPARVGRRLNARALGAAIVAAPDAPSTTAKLATSPAAFTTAEARALRIREKVSAFTTPYQCCPPRVTNIRRGAQILNGTIIPAGGRFSLNDALGERTIARGFVEAPAIAAGELVDSVGGGVSQIATTTYNAAFFAGLELIAHTPHEFYISRYPMGREATVSWRTPDLVFRNDWPAAILMSVGAGSNGITVSFYSSKLGRRIETATGQPTSRTQPKTIERKKPDLPPGTRKVVQAAGPGGFTVSYTREVYRGSKLIRDETFRWRYRPENAIVEVGPPAPEKPDEPEPTGTTTSPKPATTGSAPTPTTTAPGGVTPPTTTP